MTARAIDRLRAQVEERAVEVQVVTHDAVGMGEALFAYDRRENTCHLRLAQLGDGPEVVRIEQALLKGDVQEAALLRGLRDRLATIASESHALAGDITRLLETRDQAQLFPMEIAS